MKTGPGPQGAPVTLTPAEASVLSQAASPEGTFRACLTFDKTFVVDVAHQAIVERLLSLGLVGASGEGVEAAVRVTHAGRTWLDGSTSEPA